MNARSAFKNLSFLPRLLISFISILISCILVIGILSYHVSKKFITTHTISLNNKLLSQYSSSIDLSLIETINDISLKVIYDLNTNFFMNRFFYDSLENNLTYIKDVSKYLKDTSVVNPLILSLSIYYFEDHLLISDNYIRHTLYKPLESQDALLHYHNIVRKANEYDKMNKDKLFFVFDDSKNIDYTFLGYKQSQMPKSVIHAVRLVHGYSNIKGAVIVTLNGEIFNNFINEYAPKDLGSTYVFNEEGIIISHTDNSYIGHKISDLEYSKNFIKLNDNNYSEYFIAKANNIPVVVSYKQSLFNGWVYVSVTPLESISSLANTILKSIFIISLSSILTGLFISSLTAQKLARPIKVLAEYCLKSPYLSIVPKDNNEYTLITKTINSMESIMQKMKDDFSEALPILEMNFISSLFSDDPPNTAEIDAKIQILDLKLPFKYFCAGVIKLERHINSENIIMFEYEKLKITSILEKTYTTDHSICLYYEKENAIHVIFNFDFGENYLVSLSNKFLNIATKFNSGNILNCKYMFLGSTCLNISEINLSYKAALKNFDYLFVFPDKYLFRSSEIIEWEKNKFTSNILLNNLSNSLKSFKEKKSISDLKNLIHNLRVSNCSYKSICETLATCISFVEDFIFNKTGKNEDFNLDLNKFSDIFELESWLVDIIYREFKSFENVDTKSSILVKKAKSFIEANIQNNQLSLQYIANELGINHKYLSKIFKTETGVTFVEYLSNLKLNHSRDLLINTDLNIEEIANKMCYSTPQYFINRFKIMFGCTPNTYRYEHVAKIQSQSS